MPRARLKCDDGTTSEWKSKALRAYQRRTKAADALIASTYLAGTNTRRVRRALAALFGGAVGKDTVSRVWRKVKTDWEAWNARSLADEPIVRLILDGTVVRVRLDRKATSISLLVVIGVREDGQKVLLAVRDMGGETTEAWRTVLDDLIARGLRRPEFLIVDGAAGLEKAIAAVWNGVPLQRCTVHKHRNLLAHAPERLHEEITADYTDMIYAATAEEIEERRKAFVRKWRLRHRAVADSLEEAGDALFAFTRLPPSQWRSARTIERHRTPPRGVQAADQDPDGAAVGRHRGDVVLGAARLRPDQHAKGRWLADAHHEGRPTGRLTWPPEPIPSTRRRPASRRIPTRPATAPIAGGAAGLREKRAGWGAHARRVAQRLVWVINPRQGSRPKLPVSGRVPTALHWFVTAK